MATPTQAKPSGANTSARVSQLRQVDGGTAEGQCRSCLSPIYYSIIDDDMYLAYVYSDGDDSHITHNKTMQATSCTTSAE